MQNPLNNPTPGASYAYDSNTLTGCTPAPPGLTDSNPFGRRTSMCDGSGATSWSHDPMGRPLQERRTIGTVTGRYVTNAYNLEGSATSLTVLGYGVSYTYGRAARPLTATHSSTKFVSGATYAPQGAISSAVFGSATGFNGITVADTYNKRLQPSTITASLPSNTLVQSLTYDFHLGTADNGNVFKITNGKDANRTQNFTYDSLNRITTAATQGTTGASCWGQMFGHVSGSTFVPGIDPWGNLAEITNSQAGCASFVLSQAITAKNQFAAPMVYDSAGNLTNDGSHPFTYDAENRLTTTGGVTYTYDGDGKRVKKSNGTLYWTGAGWDPLMETDLSGNATAAYVFFNGKRVARVDMPANTVEYYFSDHLGSTDIVTNATGGIVRESDYVPYGSEIAISGADPNHYKFTGKERDAESGLDEFGARYYASSLGRFMIPDWAESPTAVPYAHYGNPQSLNLYSYVENNPTTTGDPDGHGDWDWQYTAGAVQAWASDTFAAGAFHGNSDNASFRTGQIAGDKVALAQGLGETAAGQAGVGGGTALTLSVVGAPEGALTIAGSAVLEGHGAVTASAAGIHLLAETPSGPYQRPNNATTPEQRAAVQGKPCATCGATGQKNNADHKDPLVVHYRDGKVNTDTMHDVNAVQPQCQTCSNQQGGFLSNFSKK